ncbi:hypothetical protein Spa2297_09110 [Streptomyces parvulus]|uniref:Uncharacterized protein n=1 Tax=Streptomyces parvulus TaxID=146923 RepID=A0A191UWT0_9ACTN|nr:hypothetical protein Spa2297_09110 [Streptomyces parvulus]
MPECLTRFDWREWRPPAVPDDPFPHYAEWIMGYRDFSDARDAWLAGEPVLLPPERPLPDPIPYTGQEWARRGRPTSEQPARNERREEPQAKFIATYYKRGRPRRS